MKPIAIGQLDFVLNPADQLNNRARELDAPVRGFATPMSTKQIRTRDVYVDSCLRVEHHRYFLAVKGTPVKLTRTEFRIVSFLVSNIDHIVTLQDLWNSVWEADKPLNRKCIHVFVSRVRRKLAPFGLRIDSVVDVGYIFSHFRCCKSGTSEQPHE